MPKIELKTEINSTIDICFDLARSIDLHEITTAKTKERSISGRTSGLISHNEWVTWEATHFGIKQKLTTKITAFEKPHYFVDEQLRGAFKSMRHEHTFEQLSGEVIMKDVFEFQTPFGIIGKLFAKFLLTNYLIRFLIERNNVIKDYAETDKWKLILNR